MPTRPKHPCSQPGCAALTDGRWCEKHAKLNAWKSTTTSAHDRGYGAVWRRIRARQLRREPMCQACTREVATEVDHIKPKALGGGDEARNLQSLCDRCHDEKTARDRAAVAAALRSGRGRGRRL